MADHLLMCVRGDEAEPVIVEAEGDALTFTLDDGEQLTFELEELYDLISGICVSRDLAKFQAALTEQRRAGRRA